MKDKIVCVIPPARRQDVTKEASNPQSSVSKELDPSRIRQRWLDEAHAAH